MVLSRMEARDEWSIEELENAMDGASKSLMAQFVVLPERMEHSKVDTNHAELLKLCMEEDIIPAGLRAVIISDS